MELLTKLGKLGSDSRVAEARVADIRALGFDVVADPTPDDPGHSLIIPTTADISRKSVQRALALAFHYI